LQGGRDERSTSSVFDRCRDRHRRNSSCRAGSGQRTAGVVGVRGGDVDKDGVMWGSGSNGTLVSFDRRKCKGPLNGPSARQPLP
jgi:hypothetical protein